MQRTDQAEMFLEQLASIPLTWEYVFRSPQYTGKVDKEVVDLLFVLRNRAILITMKCQQDPEKRTGDALVRWVRKSAKAGLKQLAGGIRTCRSRELWCRHPRRGRVSFGAGEIRPVRAVVVVETLEEVTLDKEMPLEVESVPVTYLSLNDFLNILTELRTFNDLLLYLEARDSMGGSLQRAVAVEKDVFAYYVFRGGSVRGTETLPGVRDEIGRGQAEVRELIAERRALNLQGRSIEELSDRLSRRLESHESGLSEELALLFDPGSERSNYLLMQDELCDLVIDERRRLGGLLDDLVEKSVREELNEGMIYRAGHLDSKPDFLYVFSCSAGLSREDIFRRCHGLIQGGLSFYRKNRGLVANYTLNRDGYEVALVRSFAESPESRRLGIELFADMRMFDIPIARV